MKLPTSHWTDKQKQSFMDAWKRGDKLLYCLTDRCRVAPQSIRSANPKQAFRGLADQVGEAMKTIAIDPGIAATGWALVDGTTYAASGTVRTETGPTAGFRAESIAREILAEIEHYNYRGAWLVVEYPQVAFGGKAFRGVMENFFVAGYLAGKLSTVASRTILVNPSEWSAGKGRAWERMESARKLALAVYGVKNRTSEHERDALAIALWMSGRE